MSSQEGALEIGAKPRDYWWTVIAVDPLALPLTRRLARSGSVSPDQVTIISVVLGLPTGLAFASGTRAGLVVGALLFYFSFLLDCVDGKLARALRTTSPRGKVLDDLGDGARRGSAAAGLAVYLWRTSAGGVFWLAVAYGFMAYYFALISGGTRGEPQTNIGGRWGEALARRRLLPTPGTPDVAALVFVLGPLTSWVAPALVVGDLLFALAILLTVYRLLRHP
ncbi:MAG: CDP-alcohol phosphatidyltransferase family protein [Actinomycetota bacterium]|nr:CDP-alcohol phosphatidyltransferase family protein [Actinomycetota bacterium]